METVSSQAEGLTYQHEENNQSLDIEDVGALSYLYKINIFGNNYIISLGNKKVHPENPLLAYYVAYLMEKGEIIQDTRVVTKLGIYEKLFDNENDINDLNIDNFDITKRTILLFKKYFTQRYLIEPLKVSDMDIESLISNKNNSQEEESKMAEEEPKAAEENNNLDDLNATEPPKPPSTNNSSDGTRTIKIGEAVLFKINEDEKISKIQLLNILKQKYENIKDNKGLFRRAKIIIKYLFKIKKLQSKEGSEIEKSISNNIDLFKKDIRYEDPIKFQQSMNELNNGNTKLTNVMLFFIEIIYNIKFITVDFDDNIRFALFDEISKIDIPEDRYRKEILKGDPDEFYFLKETESGLQHILVENNGIFTDFIKYEDMNSELKNMIQSSYSEHMDLGGLIYNNEGEHYPVLR